MLRHTEGEIQKTIEIPQVLLTFWNHEIEIVDISLEVWQKSSATPMEFSKSIEIP